MKWLQRGRQKRAVAQVLRKPLTQSELWVLAREKAANIQLRDVWSISRQMIERGLGCWLNPHGTTGKLFFWTDLGRDACSRAFQVSIPPISMNLDWHAYACVKRAKVRQAILLELAQSRLGQRRSQTAAVIRKAVRERQALGLSATLRALNKLVAEGLITYDIVEGHRAYRPTRAGEQVVRALLLHDQAPAIANNPSPSSFA